jgi:hypothetical protein
MWRRRWWSSTGRGALTPRRLRSPDLIADFSNLGAANFVEHTDDIAV